MLGQEPDMCPYDTMEALLPTSPQTYVVEQLSDLEQKKEGFEFYRLPVTQRDIELFQKIALKTLSKCGYIVSKDGTPGVVKDIYTEKNTKNLINHFVEEATEECIDDEESSEEKFSFKKTLKDIITKSEAQMMKYEKALYRAKISFMKGNIKSPLFHQAMTQLQVSKLAGMWHADSNTSDLSLISADLKFNNAHTLVLNKESSKNAFENNCTINDFIGFSRNQLCLELLNLNTYFKAPDGPYATHFLGSNIHSSPIFPKDRLFLRLDFYNIPKLY